MNFRRRTHKKYLANEKVATTRKERYGGQNAITMNEDLRQMTKTEALNRGGSVRRICRHFHGGGIKIDRNRVNKEMTSDYRDAIEELVEYKKARTVCFLTEEIMVDPPTVLTESLFLFRGRTHQQSNTNQKETIPRNFL